MRLSVIISLGASALLGTAALLVARVWIAPANKGAGQRAPVVKTAPVVVASAPMAYGDPMDPKKLVVVAYPEAVVPQGAFSSISQVVPASGAAPVALEPIAPHELIMPNKISGPGGRKSVSILIAPGMRAYAIRISDVNGVGGHVLPGDRVDVVLTRQPSQNAAPGAVKETTSDVIVQNVRVLGVNLVADPSSPTAAPTPDPRTATLEVSLQDAQRLSVASGVGNLSLALRRTGAVEQTPAKPILVKDLTVGGASSGSRSREGSGGGSGLGPVAQPPKDPSKSTVTVVQGDSASLVPVPIETIVRTLGGN